MVIYDFKLPSCTFLEISHTFVFPLFIISFLILSSFVTPLIHLHIRISATSNLMPANSPALKEDGLPSWLLPAPVAYIVNGVGSERQFMLGNILGYSPIGDCATIDCRQLLRCSCKKCCRVQCNCLKVARQCPALCYYVRLCAHY